MLLFYNSLWKEIHDLTGVEVEKRAVMELIAYFEPMIKEVIIESKRELERLNEQKRIQNVYQKKRIDDECMRRAIKSINAREYPLMSERQTGGNISKNEIEIETHLKEEDVLTEVT